VQITEDIENFKVQGANQIALYGLSFLRKVAVREGFGPRFSAATKRLEKTRSTAVVLHNCLEIIKSSPKISTIDSLIDTLTTAGKRESIYSDKIIKPGSKIMTYCHSGEAMSFIKHARTAHKNKISVIACKTEPLEQGVTTAKELSAVGIPVTLIDDNAAGFFINEVDMVIVGADALRREGVVNKIGTSLLAQAAAGASTPLYVVANSLKIDHRRSFRIEERPATEVLPKKGLRKIKVRNPAFDITPWQFVTMLVNENGIFTGKQFVILL